MMTSHERIIGCLKGVATGDAIGKQTETLSRQQVTEWYPDGVRGFEGTPGSVIPRYVGHRKREWRIGETTDDTERTIAVARAIIKDRTVSHAGVGREMLGCRKSVHPGVQSLWRFHEANDPERVDLEHDGCGAAIRVAPVGIVYSSGNLNGIFSAAREASIPTHGDSLAIAGAAATAAAVSAAIDGASGEEIGEFAARAAAIAETLWPSSRGAVFSLAVRSIRNDLKQRTNVGADELAERYFPETPLTKVPLALALGTLMRSVGSVILLATNVGGDADSIASIAGGILGARHPDSVNDEWYDVVDDLNNHNLIPIAEELSALRAQGTIQQNNEAGSP